jgi:gamma-glutamyltranspeptidase/glutathione hydrolase
VTREMDASGGLITKADLAAYQPAERAPVTGIYHGYRIVSMPPPSSGGVGLLELLNILEPYPLAEYGPTTARTMHLMIEAERRVYADRAEWLGDPDFFKVPVKGMISKSYADRLRASIDESHATPSADVRAGAPRDFEPTETTHYSVVDADGNSVSTTTTLNGGFGNAEMVAGAGFLLNNEMDDFSARPNSPNMFGLLGGEANAVAPGKRMLSSMTPTIVSRDGRTVLVLGSPGGSHIITTVLQVLINHIDFGMSLPEAIAAPRASQRNGAKTDAEPAFYNSALAQQLSSQYGEVFNELSGPVMPRDSYIGNATGIQFLPGNQFQAAAEPVRLGGGSALVVNPQ